MNGWMWNMGKWCVHTNAQSDLKILKVKSVNSKVAKHQLFVIAIAKPIIIKIKFSMKESLRDDYNFKILPDILGN